MNTITSYNDKISNTEVIENRQTTLFTKEEIQPIQEDLYESGIENVESRKADNTKDIKQYFSNSLEILEKIQNEFEKSAKNNMENIEFTSRITGTNVANLLTDNELFANHENSEKIMKNSNDFLRNNIVQVKHVPEYEKEMVHNHIQNNSITRLNNYKSIFNLIKSTLSDIRENFNEIQEKNEKINEILINKEKEKTLETFECNKEEEKVEKCVKIEKEKAENLNTIITEQSEKLENYQETEKSDNARINSSNIFIVIIFS